MRLKLRRKQLLSAVLSSALLLTQLPPVSANQPPPSSVITVLSGAYDDSITVSTHQQLMNALEQEIKHIKVNGLITIGREAEESGRMKPVFIPEGTIIEGTSGSIINCRCPIQLEGDGVTFKNIELIFESSDALGSIPHREIFLAGYSLTLDNVSTYLEGGGGAFGPLGGYEAELLPTVFAGGYQNTSIGSNAVLTIKNSNSKTIFQDIYMGHEAGEYQHVPYREDTILTLDNSVAVRGGIYTDQNSSAEIFLNGNGKSLFNNVKATNFIGNDETILTMTGCSASSAVMDEIGTIVLKDNSYLMPQTSQFHNISLQENSCLDLSEVVNATITGDFEGGYYDFNSNSYQETSQSNVKSSDTNTAGILVLDKEGTLTIEGSVTGTTIFQTESKNFPGIPIVGKEYIIADWNEINEKSFIISEKYKNEYDIRHNTDAWSVFKLYGEENMGVPSIGSVEISNAPLAIDLAKIKTEGFDIPDPSTFCKVIWKDIDGNIIDFYDIINEYGFDAVNILCIKTEYLEDSSYNAYTDWGNSVYFTYSEEYPDCFYFIANEKAKIGNYTFRFYSVDTEEKGIVEDSTIEDVKELDDFMMNEIQIYFYDSSETNNTTSIDEFKIQPISEQIYTGKSICPEVRVIHESSGEELKAEENYVVSYENNINVGEATVKVVGIGNYSGEITETFSIVKSESDVAVTATMGSNGTNTDPVIAVYGDKIRFVCQAVPAEMTRAALLNTVDFYCDDVLLGTASVDSKGQAVFVYNTAEQKIPVGTSTISADFGGNATLNPAQSKINVSVTLNKQVLAKENIKSITLKDFTYDGTRKTTEILSLTLGSEQDSSTSNREDQTIFISGEAELTSVQAGTYAEAKILSWSLNEKDSDWYELPKISTSILVEPEVTIIPAKAPEQVTIHSSAKPNETQTVSISEVVPTELLSANTDYQLGKEQFGSSILGTPTITNGELTYQAGQSGTETIPVIVTLENHQPMTVLVTILVTDKENIKLNLTSSDMTYNGKLYDGWNIEDQKDMNMTVTYYDLIEQQPLTEAPKDAGSYSITVHVENDTKVGEETSNFQINPKEIHICPIDRTILIGEEIPNLDNPKLSIDYEFESGYEPIEGEDLGTVKMLYENLPDNTKEGDYKIFIRLLEKNPKNYKIIEKEGNLHIATSEEHIHKYVETITKEATCTENGIKTYTCSDCQNSYTEEIPTISHSIKIIPAKEATCTETGKTEGKYCSVCNIILTEQSDIPKKDHSYGDWIIDKAATSTSEGEKHRVCNICQNIETATIPKLDGETETPPTETTPEETETPPTETTPEETETPPTETTPEETETPPTETTPEETETPPTETTPEETETPPTETTPEEIETSPTEDNNTENNNSDNKENSTTIIPEKETSTTNKTDYKDPIKGYISLAQGIITGKESGYAEWKQSNGIWWLQYANGTWPYGQLTNDGQQIYKWERINGEWYAFDIGGYAKDGWFLDAGYQSWFYIDINNGMKTGWQLIEGKWYYFNPISDGTKGRMYSDCYTPDGWYVDKSGAWDGKPQQKK